jgi:hypothetical protein
VLWNAVFAARSTGLPLIFRIVAFPYTFFIAIPLIPFGLVYEMGRILEGGIPFGAEGKPSRIAGVALLPLIVLACVF